MRAIYHEKIIINNKFINYGIYFYVFFLLFEILIRAIVPNGNAVFTFLKLLFSFGLISYIIFVKKRFISNYSLVHLIFWVYIIITGIKLLNEGNIGNHIIWLSENNNINYYFWYLYFVIFSQLKNEINITKLFEVMKTFNYIIILISFILFFTNDYLGMVTYENLLAYSWVGTSRLRMMSIFGNPNHAGLYFVLMLYILDYERIKNAQNFFCLSNILLTVCNILTFSRTSIVCMLIYLFIRNRMLLKKNVKKGISLILKKYKYVIITIIATIITYIIINKNNVYFFKLSYLIENSRWEKWNIGIKYVIEHYLIGTPFNQTISGMSTKYGLLIFSDNIFIEIGTRFGFLFMLIVILYIIYLLVKSLKNRNFINFNKLQILIIPSLLSGTLHFSVPLILFTIYSILCTEHDIKKDSLSSL